MCLLEIDKNTLKIGTVHFSDIGTCVVHAHFLVNISKPSILHHSITINLELL